MAKISTNISIDADVKAKAQALFADFGMDLSTAVNIFFRQAIHENAIPFNISRDIPNRETISALEEARDIIRHPEQYKKYSSFSEVLREVTSDA